MCEPVGLGTEHNITAFIQPLRLSRFQCFRPTYFFASRAKGEGGFLSLIFVFKGTGGIKSLGSGFLLF